MQKTEVVVVGSGPGGYVAALHAADQGREVVLVEAREQLGGVCLLEGCIPSKALISTVELIAAVKDAKSRGLSFKGLSIDTGKLREFTEGVISGLSNGISGLMKNRKISVVRGRAKLTGANQLVVEGPDDGVLQFDKCILATGSRVLHLPMWNEADVWTSTEALELSRVPERLLVVGGGYIGLELGFVYAGLGSKVSVVELTGQLLGGADKDLVRPVQKHAKNQFESVWLNTKLTAVKRLPSGMFAAELEDKDGRRTEEFDQVLVAVGRKPNTDNIGLETVGITPERSGHIPVSATMQTAVPTIYAIGDIVPGPGLAHKASREGKVAAEVISGKPSAFDNVSIPAIVFTDPEVAWTGITENEAKAQGLKIKVGKFPLSALGRARTMNRTDGMAKVILDADTGLVRGVGIVGPHASELIAEAVLALEMGAVAEDLTVAIHPHPTLSEAIMEAAEVAAHGYGTHLPRK